MLYFWNLSQIVFEMEELTADHFVCRIIVSRKQRGTEWNSMWDITFPLMPHHLPLLVGVAACTLKKT